eukprot:TRINITY_DN33485_c0_g1_i1.p1 TRINITY_DN33485_c0_g1~~TRINITY_DN33485_c0_g1_i1.p1  ORF type:complete len:262 (+),score=48.55 TRINITY_DN33485_c0_g1_i1:75-860(+)
MPRAVFLSQDVYLAQLQQSKNQLVLPTKVVQDDSETQNQTTPGCVLPTHKVPPAPNDSGSNSDSTHLWSHESSSRAPTCSTPPVDQGQQEIGGFDDDCESGDWSTPQHYWMDETTNGNYMKESRTWSKNYWKTRHETTRWYRRHVRGRTELREEDIFAQGKHCTARKHLRLGCAIVTFCSSDLKAKVMDYVKTISPSDAPTWSIGFVSVSLQPHYDNVTQEVDETSIFVFWGRQVEKRIKVRVPMVSSAFDALCEDVLRNM